MEEYNPELIYIQGTKNIVADALSRLDCDETSLATEEEVADYFNFDESKPLTYLLRTLPKSKTRTNNY